MHYMNSVMVYQWDHFLDHYLANIILTEFENVIVEPLTETSGLKFYCRYIDVTLVTPL